MEDATDVRTCSVPGCSGTFIALGMCDMHYRRTRKHGDPYGTIIPSDEDRFWSSVAKSESGCWTWQRSRSGTMGYGRIRISGTRMMAHRFSYELHHGPIPEGLFVLHSCDNPPCVNPAHLRLGTQRENMADRGSRGRQARGSRLAVNARAFSEDEVRSIRRDPRPSLAVAKDHGVVPGTIWKIRKGRSYAWVV